MVFTISFINTVADRAFPAGITRIDNDQRDAGSFCLVSDKSFQFVKSPRVVDISLILSNPDSLTDALKIFQNDRLIRAFSVSDNLFTYAVVDIFGKTRFFAATMLKKALCGLCAFLLELTAQFKISVAAALQFVARIGLSRTGGGDLADSKVNTHKTIGFEFGRFWDIADLVKVKSVVSENKIGFTLQGFQQFKLFWSCKERDFEPARHGPYGDNLLIEFPGKNARIKGYTAMFCKGAFGFFVQLVGVSNLGSNPDNNLSRQAKAILDDVILCLVDIVLPKYLILPGKVTDKICRIIDGFKSQFQRGKLFLSRIEFYLGSQFQVVSFQVWKELYFFSWVCQQES